jgi:hypothetical protein
MPSGRPGIVHIEGSSAPRIVRLISFFNTGIALLFGTSSYQVHQQPGSGGLTAMPPQHKKSIPINAPALWKPKALLCTIRSLLLKPSTIPFVSLVSM